MRSLLPLASVLFAALVLGCSKPAPPSAATWITYASPDGQFTASFPKEPVRKETKTPAGKSSILIRASLDNDQVGYEIQYAEGANYAGAQELLAKAPAAMVKAKNGTLLKEVDIRVGEWNGRAFSFSANLNNVPSIVHIRMIITGKRAYILSVTGKSELVSESDAEKFLTSFVVNERVNEK